MIQQATKQHILEKTIEAIEKHGIQNLTTRVIADEAGVNNAALHYYYGTKEALLAQALEQTLQHMLEDTGEILLRPENLEERLHALFAYLVGGILNFPNIIRAHIQGPLMEGKFDTPFIKMLNTWLQQIYAGMEADVPAERKQSIRLAAFGSISTCLLAGLIPNADLHMDVHTPTGQEAFIRYLVDSLMHTIAGGN